MNSDYIMDQALNKNATIKISLLYNCLLIIEKSIQRGAFSVKELPQIVEVTEPLSRYIDKAVTLTTNQYKKRDDKNGSEGSELFKKYTQEINSRKIAAREKEMNNNNNTNPFDNINFDNNSTNNNNNNNNNGINNNNNNNVNNNNNADIGVIDFNNTRPVVNEPQVDTRPSWLMPEETRAKRDEIVIPKYEMGSMNRTF
jgi:hypothetical protein